MKHGGWLVATALALLAALIPVQAQTSMETGFTPLDAVTVWPLHIAHGYPLVRGQVGDVQGVFMIDTGTPWGILLNRARVRLADATYLFSGAAGSGQKFDVFRSDTLPGLVLHGQTWSQVRSVHSADFSFVESGTGMGPFLGFIGANFFKNAELTLDYARRVAVVRQLHADTGVPLAPLPRDLAQTTVLASVNYRGERDNFPLFDALLDGAPVQVMLDSGNPGATLDAAWLSALRQAGAAQPFSQIDGRTSYRLRPLQIGGLSVPVDDAVSFGAPAAAAGQTGTPTLKLGFSLLSRLGVTWNYRLKTMAFFKP